MLEANNAFELSDDELASITGGVEDDSYVFLFDKGACYTDGVSIYKVAHLYPRVHAKTKITVDIKTGDEITEDRIEAGELKKLDFIGFNCF